MTALTVTTAAVLIGMTALATAQDTPEVHSQVRKIVVSLEDHKLALVEDGQVVKVYTVAVGKPSTPSPEGTFTIERCVKNPVYHHDGKTVQPGPRRVALDGPEQTRLRDPRNQRS
jgi:lipoprotein-anchoring transpeptidase ErfK/SrfK